MPSARVNGTDLYYEDTQGPGEPVVFLHGFLFDGRQYEAQVASLRDRYRCITLDFRGQGRSTASRGGYQIEQHMADVLALIRRLDIAPVHLVGLSMGGFVALRIAAREPGLLRSLTLLNTSAAAHARSKFPKQLLLAGVARVAGVSLPLLRSGIEGEMYGAAFRKDPARGAERGVWRQRWERADRSSLVKTLLGFMIRPDVRDELGNIAVPTLVIAGGADASLPPTFSREIHSLVAGSRLVELPGVGHSSPVEDPDGVTKALERFLDDIRADRP
ncbi:Pimeloyl-ACP methyl ester carboxylesterase [Micromonospora rhizosphaerae]|uniref:Pimeloyl-ACP methyl ester carboxylesterase n=1 Tax=Micromonospora rhizosphaerae TaxID=568872 RepID=A0A1C6SLG6_9ACTN|nr:alpha/beta hydrolase [Micromonospora rhizosphaerae]SCL30386.1 Pimeloyl-ACP methyl ester carboxylesterase [Micromonospora rhizosphaerae]